MAGEAPETVAVVDDNEANRYVVQRILERAGFRVFTGGSGAEAFELIAQGPDMLVLDVRLPDISGTEICRRVKENPETASIAVLHISASFVRAEDRALGLEWGADAYLVAPIEPTELVATVRALMRLRRAETAARLAACQWEATFDAIRDGICLTDAYGRIVRANRALSELLDLPETSLPGEDYDALLARRLAGLRTQSGAVASLPGRHVAEAPAGHRWFRLTVDPVRDDVGRMTGAVHVLSDISERKRLEIEKRRHTEELDRANRAKDEFLAMLGHELRNPLSPILNSVQSIRERSADEALVARAGEVIERQAYHMSRLVNDLLDVSRITRGTIELRRARVEVAALVGNCVETIRPSLDERSQSLEVSLPGEPVFLYADPTRMEQILTNLLSNAVKYTPQGGCIWVAAEVERGRPFADGRAAGVHPNAIERTPQDWLVLRVRDNGRGIPVAMQTSIFDLFAQVDPTIDRSQGGLGLGLTLVRRLVEMHGGTVDVTSEGDGAGSEFSVRLPVAGVDAPGPEVVDGPLLDVTADGAARREPGARRILIVEDNADARETLRDLLEMWGHEVSVAPDGSSAVETALQFQPDLALIDIGLPGLDGYEVARRIRSEPTGIELRLVALTGYGQPEDRRRALEAGFDSHLVKPVELDQLKSLLG